MANIDIVFKGTEETGTDGVKLECFVNPSKEISITLNDGSDVFPVIISLDESTAVKFCKVLRTEISKIKGVNRG